MNATEQITKLIDWKGGWSMRALFDNAISRHLNSEKQDFELAKLIVQESSGISATRYFEKYCNLTGFTFENVKIPEHLDPDTKQVIDLTKIVNIPYELTADFWLEKICIHLNTNRKNLTHKIEQVLNNDELPRGNPKQLLEKWSFPMISSFLPLEIQKSPISYLEAEIANICWKRWYLTKENQPLLLETPNRTGLNSSQWLVWRLLHDATHLLHLQNFKNAGSYLEPNWLVTLESIAMNTELNFLRLIDEDVEIKKPDDYPFNVFNIKTFILVGLLERALRLDYDLAIHLEGKNVETWLKQTKRKTGFNLNCYEFTNEFHGLPGFCSSYMLGLKAFEIEPDKLSVLNRTKPLNWLNLCKNEDFSRSPLTDIPARLPQHSIYIQSVGTSEAACFFNLLNPFTKEYNNVEAIAHVTVSLSAYQRGIHMSRLQQILNSLNSDNWDKLEDVTHFIAQQAKYLQSSDRAEATLMVNSYLETFNYSSQTKSKQPVTFIASTLVSENEITNTIGLTAKVMTACPCTLEYSKLIAKQNLKDRLGLHFNKSIMNYLPPSFTHSQRGTLTTKVSSKNNLISLNNLHHQINSVAHLVESVLKRPDEHFLVKKSHQKPQFCEDLCREVAVAIASQLGADDKIEITVELDESIHPHKAFSQLTVKAYDIWYA